MDAAERRAEFNRLRRRLERLERSGATKPAWKRGAGALSEQDLRRIVQRSKPAEDGAASPGLIQYKRNLPRTTHRLRGRTEETAARIPLSDIAAGTERILDGRGKAYVIPTRVDSVEGAFAVSEAFRDALADPESPLCLRLCGAAAYSVDDVLFMDVESTGLSSSPLFLIGIMVWDAGGLQVRQFLARDYSEEAAVLACFLGACAGKRLLVTFNGKSFDVPYIRARSAASGVPYELAAEHFDLLHECRRVWKGELPDCRLQTLERCICGRVRHDDIPGGDIPEAYHAFVRTGDAGQMALILKHNMLDLVTLAELMTRFPA